MRRFLSVLLALTTVFSFSTFAFAYENADNTFNSYTPAIGTKAPENWFDPCCYDADGLLRTEALSGGRLEHSLALYCKKYKRIFTTSCIGAITENGIFYDPYSYEIPSESNKAGFIDLSYCPYCGEKETLDSNDRFGLNHIEVLSVAYGADCPDCGLHNISYDLFVSIHQENNGCIYCLDCKRKYKPERLTRYISSEMMKSEYSFIFDETAHKYGNGKDCPADDLVLFPEDDVYLRRDDIPKKDLIRITIRKNWIEFLEWLSGIYETIKGWFIK